MAAAKLTPCPLDPHVTKSWCGSLTDLACNLVGRRTGTRDFSRSNTPLRGSRLQLPWNEQIADEFTENLFYGNMRERKRVESVSCAGGDARS